MKKNVFVAVLALCALAGGLYWYYSHKGTPSNPESGLTLYGNIDIRQANVGFRVFGRITELKWEEGDFVKKGEVLARIDDTPLRYAWAQAQAQLERARAQRVKLEAGYRPQEIELAKQRMREAEAAFTLADKDYQRYKNLIDQKSVSPQTYDNAVTRRDQMAATLAAARQQLSLVEEGFRREDIEQARAEVAQAQAALDLAKTQLDDTILISPQDAVILTRVMEPGTVAIAGAPVYSLSVLTPVWARVYVAEPDLAKVSPGLVAEVYSDTNPRTVYKGHIGYISPEAEFTPKSVQTPQLRTTLVYRARVIVDNPDEGLRQGMPVTVRILPGQRPNYVDALYPPTTTVQP